MKKQFLTLSTLFSLVLIIACGQGEVSKFPDYTMKENNLYIKFFKENPEAREVVQGDVISLKMRYTTQDDSILFDHVEGQPLIKMQADTGKYEGDFLGAFIGMHEGDSVSIIVDADSFFIKTAGMRQSPTFIDSGSVLYFSVSIDKVQSMAELEQEQNARNAEAMQNEQVELSQYLEANGIDATPTASGLIYISKSEGTGPQAEPGDIVRVAYAGRLLNGTYFDTSIEEVAQEQGMYNAARTYEPYQFTLGNGEVIRGWDEGIALMKQGGKATLIIPSSIAYGANPRPGGVIQPYNTLVFEVELAEVTKQ